MQYLIEITVGKATSVEWTKPAELDLCFNGAGSGPLAYISSTFYCTHFLRTFDFKSTLFHLTLRATYSILFL